MLGKLIKGRQLVWMIFNHFRLNSDMKMLYDIEDIAQLEWMGDQKIHSFYRIWFMMTKECEVPLPERTLRNMLSRKLEASVKLKEDLAYYHRLPEDHEQKTYAYLVHCMERLMSRAQESTNFTDRKKGFKALTGQGS